VGRPQMDRTLLAAAGAIHAGLKHVRNRVITALCKRAASAEPFQREGEATPRAMALDSFVCIIRARWMVLAGAAKEGCEKNLINAKKHEQGPADH
jgi:hypothetical protein